MRGPQLKTSWTEITSLMGKYLQLTEKQGKADRILDLFPSAVEIEKPSIFYDPYNNRSDYVHIAVVENTDFDAALVVLYNHEFYRAVNERFRPVRWIRMDLVPAFISAGIPLPTPSAPDTPSPI